MGWAEDWVQRRPITLGLAAFFLSWYLLQLGILHVYGDDVARWWFYFEKPPDTVSPGMVFGPISHDMWTLTHISANVGLLLVAGGFAEPYIGKNKILFIVFGLGYLGTYLANLTALIHLRWMIAGASGGILALWAYVGLRLRHKAYRFRDGVGWSRKGLETYIALVLLVGIFPFLFHEMFLQVPPHSGHVIGLATGCVYFVYEAYAKRE